MTSFSNSKLNQWTIHDAKVYRTLNSKDNIEIREFDISREKEMLFARVRRSGSSSRVSSIDNILWYATEKSFVLDMQNSNATQTIASFRWEE